MTEHAIIPPHHPPSHFLSLPPGEQGEEDWGVGVGILVNRSTDWGRRFVIPLPSSPTNRRPYHSLTCRRSPARRNRVSIASNISLEDGTYSDLLFLFGHGEGEGSFAAFAAEVNGGERDKYIDGNGTAVATSTAAVSSSESSVSGWDDRSVKGYRRWGRRGR